MSGRVLTPAEAWSARIALPGQLATPLAALGLVVVFGLACHGWSGGALPAAGPVAVFLAAAVASVAGFAFSLVCAPLLAPLEPDAVRMVQALALCSIAIQGYGIVALRLRPEWRLLLPLLLGSLAGLPLGVWVLMATAARGYAGILGALVLGYALLVLLRPPLRLTAAPSRWMHALVGGCGGLTGGLVASPALALAIWCGMQGWSKERQRAVYQPIILAMQPATLLTIALLGGDGHGPALPDPMLLAYVPPALLGAVFGVRLFRRLSDAWFGRMVNLLLAAAGLALLV